jgi:hypothetical protein
MAMPILYWLLECGTCRRRRVVHDVYLAFVGSGSAEDTGEGYGGPPLEYRYDCLKGCPGPTRVVGSIASPTDTAMWQHQPRKRIDLDRRQSEEWWRLLREAGFEAPAAPVVARRTAPAAAALSASEVKMLRLDVIESLRTGNGVSRSDKAKAQSPDLSHCVLCAKPFTKGVIVDVRGLRRSVCSACQGKFGKSWWQFWK